MPQNTTPLRPGANTTVPYGIPILNAAVASPGTAVHTSHPTMLEELHVWLRQGSAKNVGQGSIELMGTANPLLFQMNPALAAPIKVLDGIPVRGGGLVSMFHSAVAAGMSVTGHVVRSSDGRRPLQPVVTATPTGAGAAVATSAAGGTLAHTLSDGKLDELHVWVNNPTAGALAALGWGISSTALLTGVAYAQDNDGAVPAYSSLKVIDGLVVRGGAGVAQSLFFTSSVGCTVYGYFIRRN